MYEYRPSNELNFFEATAGPGGPYLKSFYIYGYIQVKKLERLKERKKIETLGVTLSPQI